MNNSEKYYNTMNSLHCKHKPSKRAQIAEKVHTRTYNYITKHLGINRNNTDEKICKELWRKWYNVFKLEILTEHSND